MKQISILVLFFLLLLQVNECHGQEKYFDANGKEIRSIVYKRLLRAGGFLDIERDDGWHLIKRENKGRLQREIFDQIKTFYSRDDSEMIVILYHPGKDEFNSGGKADKEWLQRWHQELRKMLKSKYSSIPTYVFKSKSGLDKYRGIVNYIPDIHRLIENTFFKEAYPSGSFVVVNKNGSYISYFGEYAVQTVERIARKTKRLKAKHTG